MKPYPLNILEMVYQIRFCSGPNDFIY
uniref:Uncharacterized protein n=1 Tax=Anguilla anguilla TaxID=7936 RepID=A0A0E9T345_ANGAN